MIGGDDMYMPLCRECHRRETRLNKHNAFVGDPSVTSVEVESVKFPMIGIDSEGKNRIVATPQSAATTITEKSDSPK